MKVAYVFGRFQPFHLGHKAMLDKALQVADEVVVIFGDTGCRPDFKNPWSVEERKQMVRDTYAAYKPCMTFVSVEDTPYDDDEWRINVRQAIREALPEGYESKITKEYLIGYRKDHSSFYLDMFPNWEFVDVDPHHVKTFDGSIELSATDIRRSYFGAMGGNINWKFTTPPAVKDWLERYFENERESYNQFARECLAVDRHNAEWDCEAVRKYGGPVIAAVDALMHSRTHVLLIRRGGGVGKGALALPGGFVDPSERLIPAAVRELKEETGIVIEKDYFDRHHPVFPFDHPGRSMRGRIITNIVPIFVRDNTDFEPVAGDDAAEALWVKISDLPSLKREFFADHYHIIKSLI